MGWVQDLWLWLDAVRAEYGDIAMLLLVTVGLIAVAAVTHWLSHLLARWLSRK